MDMHTVSPEELSAYVELLSHVLDELDMLQDRLHLTLTLRNLSSMHAISIVLSQELAILRSWCINEREDIIEYMAQRCTEAVQQAGLRYIQ